MSWRKLLQIVRVPPPKTLPAPSWLLASEDSGRHGVNYGEDDLYERIFYLLHIYKTLSQTRSPQCWEVARQESVSLSPTPQRRHLPYLGSHSIQFLEQIAWNPAP